MANQRRAWGCAWGLQGPGKIHSWEMGPSGGQESPQGPRGWGRAGLDPAGLGPSHCPRPLVRDWMFSLTSTTTGPPTSPTSLPLVLILQAPEVGGRAVMGFGVGKGERPGGEIQNPTSNPSPPPRMTVMSLVVLVLSWGSLGLEAATAVVSAEARLPDPGAGGGQGHRF